jgi:deoxyribodipyrimidine photolyase
MSGTLDTVVVWFRRDLRVYDNPALVAAVNSARNVIPLYVWAAEEEVGADHGSGIVPSHVLMRLLA